MLDDIEKKIFVEGHREAPYYASALGHYRLENFFRNNLVAYAKFKSARFHILMCVRHFIVGSDLPPGNSKQIDVLAESLCEVFNDAAVFKATVDRAIKLLDKEGFKFDDRDSFKLQASNDKLVAALRSVARGSSFGARPTR